MALSIAARRPRPRAVNGTHYILQFAAEPGPAEQAWQEYCHVLLCANEFIYID